MPNYNIMGPAKAALEATSRQLAYELGADGIRVNCLSPGPMNTVSARGIPGISVRSIGSRCSRLRLSSDSFLVVPFVVSCRVSCQRMRKYSEEHSPLRRNASGAEVGSVAAFLASDLASSITGQTIYGGSRILACMIDWFVASVVSRLFACAT